MNEKPPYLPVEERPSAYVRLADGTTWPHPSDLADIEWALRYGVADRSDELIAASYIAAYRALVWSTHRQRSERVGLLRAAVDTGYLDASEPPPSAPERDQ